MADQKITELNNNTSDSDNDLIPVVINTATVPETVAVTRENLASAMGVLSGWIVDEDTWTYASSTTFTVATDKTAIFTPGVKIRITQGTLKYYYVVSSSYSAPNTTVTVTGGSDYTIANSAISAGYYSRASNPLGFPQWFNYTPTFTNCTTGDGTLFGKFCIVGRKLLFKARFTLGGTSAVTGTVSISTPCAIVDTTYVPTGNTMFSDATGSIYLGQIGPASSATVVPYVGKADATYLYLSVINGTIPFTWAANDFISVEATCEI